MAAVRRDHGKPFVTIFASVKNSWESPPTVNIFCIYMESYISIWHTIIKKLIDAKAIFFVKKPSHNQRIAEWKIVLLCKLIPEAKSVTGKLFFRSVTLRPQ